MYGTIKSIVGNKAVKVAVKITKIYPNTLKRVRAESVIKARYEKEPLIGKRVFLKRSRPFAGTIRWLATDEEE